MYDLFRFIMLRPPEKVDNANVISLDEDTPFRQQLKQAVSGEKPQERTKAIAEDFIKSDQFAGDPSKLHYAGQLDNFKARLDQVDLLEPANLDPVNLKKLVDNIFDEQPSHLIREKKFTEDKKNIGDSLIAIRIAGSAKNASTADLSLYLRLTDLIERIAGEDQGLNDRAAIGKALRKPIVLPADLITPPAKDTRQDQPVGNGQSDFQALKKKMDNLQELYTLLGNIPTEDLNIFDAKPVDNAIARGNAISAGEELISEVRDLHSMMTADKLNLQNVVMMPMEKIGAVAGTKLTLTAEATDRIPGHLKTALSDLQLDPAKTTLPVMTDRIRSELVNISKSLPIDLLFSHSNITVIGNKTYLEDSFVEPFGFGAPIIINLPVLPITHGSVKPVGIGDLLVVRQQLTGYETGEVAHIENILKGETNTREVTRSETTEDITTTETENITEEERDLQSTERFEMQRESQNIVSIDGRLKGGGMQSPSYGPAVEFENNNDSPLHGSQQVSEKQASNFSQDVTSRASTKITERTRTQVMHRTLREFVEKDTHSFDNKAGNSNIAGIYQWVDKVYQNQVYNYGKRLFYDIVVPEPASFFIKSQGFGTAEGIQMEKPPAFNLTANDITEWGYASYAALYGATGIEPPPARNITISKAFVEQSPDKIFINKNFEIPIPKDYEAKWYKAKWSFFKYKDQPPEGFFIYLGATDITAGEPSLQSESTSLSLLLSGYNLVTLGVSLDIYCQRTDARLKLWQTRTFESILSAYRQRVAEYEERLASLQASLRIGAIGQNPDKKRQIEKTELKKNCISLFTDQYFDIFNGITVSPQLDPDTKKPVGYPQIKLPEAGIQGNYIRFFEQAFEWEQMMYQYYPYFWGRKDQWMRKINMDDADQEFADFLKAGAARVLVPVRPGFESALLHFMETGEIWEGGDMPDINSPMYLPLLQEMMAVDGAKNEAIPYGDSWKVRLPTTLVKLKDTDKLPAWKEVNGQWEPVD